MCSMKTELIAAIPIISTKHVDSVPVCHHSMLTAPTSDIRMFEYVSSKLVGCMCQWVHPWCFFIDNLLKHSLESYVVHKTLQVVVNHLQLPCPNKFVTGWKSSPSMDCFKRTKVECQVFDTIRATMVEVNTRSNFGFTRHGCWKPWHSIWSQYDGLQWDTGLKS